MPAIITGTETIFQNLESRLSPDAQIVLVGYPLLSTDTTYILEQCVEIDTHTDHCIKYDRYNAAKAVRDAGKKLSKLQEFLTGSEVSDEIKLAIGNLLTAENSETVATFIELRISGSTVDTAVNSIRLKRLSSERGDINVSISDITTYLTTMLAEDHEAIFSMYTGYRYHLESDIASIKASVEKPEVFVDKVSDAMANFSNTELLEELLFKIPLFVAVINKLIDTAKF